MKNYEVIVLVKEETTETQIKEIEKAIVKEAKIIKFEDEGIKRLCYMVNGREKAHFLFWLVEATKNASEKIYNMLCANDNSLRHLVVKEIVKGSVK